MPVFIWPSVCLCANEQTEPSMILPNMSRREISLHLMNERRSIEQRLQQIVSGVKEEVFYRSQSALTLTLTTPNATEFSIYISSSSRQCRITTGAWYPDGRKKTFVITHADSVIFVNQHFFDRYAQRLLRSNQPILKTAEQFFRRNTFRSILRVSKRFQGITMIFEDGLGLGGFWKDYIELNTFITKD